MRLRKNVIQGFEAIGIGLLCYWTNAVGAALAISLIGISLLVGKRGRKVC